MEEKGVVQRVELDGEARLHEDLSCEEDGGVPELVEGLRSLHDAQIALALAHVVGHRLRDFVDPSWLEAL